ncbi:MAG: hydrolase [Actinobacteria bacterium]|nr:hydrolase [Actinomycetota bacterium]
MVALVTAVPVASSAPPAPPAPPAPAPAARASVRVVAASAPAAAPPPPLSAAARAVETALKELGRPYRYGALGPSTFDCSGLTKFAYGAAGIVLPHSAAAQYGSGRRVNRNQLQPGDLIFWKGLGHVGMYVGAGRMVHAPQTGQLVTITSIDQGAYLGAVRPGT